MIKNFEIAKEWFGDIVRYLQFYHKGNFQSIIVRMREIQSSLDELIEKTLQKFSVKEISGFKRVLEVLIKEREEGKTSTKSFKLY